MNLVSLLVLPAIISLSDISVDTTGSVLSIRTTPEPAAYVVAAVALAVLLGAIAFSKRGGAGIADIGKPAEGGASAGGGDAETAQERTDVAEAATAPLN
jgi:hypothetical protein